MGITPVPNESPGCLLHCLLLYLAVDLLSAECDGLWIKTLKYPNGEIPQLSLFAHGLWLHLSLAHGSHVAASHTWIFTMPSQTPKDINKTVNPSRVLSSFPIHQKRASFMPWSLSMYGGYSFILAPLLMMCWLGRTVLRIHSYRSPFYSVRLAHEFAYPDQTITITMPPQTHSKCLPKC